MVTTKIWYGEIIMTACDKSTRTALVGYTFLQGIVGGLWWRMITSRSDSAWWRSHTGVVKPEGGRERERENSRLPI